MVNVAGSGARIGAYEPLQLVHRGRRRLLVRCRDVTDGSVVVLKMVRRGWRAHEPTRRRLVREYHIARKAVHPGLIAVRALGHHERAAFLVLEDHPFGALMGEPAIALQRNRRAVLSFVRELAEAVHCFHASGVIHLDVKPANILLDRRGRPVLTDYGLARSARELRRPRYLGGTPGFMSPEQAFLIERSVDHRSDVFSLGVLLHALFVGSLPFRARTRSEYFAALTASPTWPVGLTGAGDAEVMRVLSRALAFDPDERYSTAEEMANDLGTLPRERSGI